MNRGMVTSISLHKGMAIRKRALRVHRKQRHWQQRQSSAVHHDLPNRVSSLMKDRTGTLHTEMQVEQDTCTSSRTEKLLRDLGLTEIEVEECITEAMGYWERKGSENFQRLLLCEQVDAVLMYLVDVGIPVRNLPEMVRSCPALLTASLEVEIIPIVQLLQELRIHGKSFMCLCKAHPSILLEGKPDSIRHVVQTFRSMGIHESQVHMLIRLCPSLLLLSADVFTKKMRSLAKLFSTEEDLILFVRVSPHVIHDSAKRFKAVHKALKKIGMTTNETLACVRKEPRLLTKDAQKLEAIVVWFVKSGLTESETKSLLQVYPQLLIRQLFILKEKKNFLISVAGRPFSDVLTFPIYFHYAIDRIIGPRFTFLRERRNPALRTATLESIIHRSNEDFAQSVAKVLEAEYLVYQAQWTRMYGHKFNFVGQPKRTMTSPNHTD